VPRPTGRPAPADPLAGLERDPLRPYYLLHGEESFLVERALAVLRRRIDAPDRPRTWRTLSGEQDAERLAGALADLRSPSLFGGRDTLVVRQAHLLREDEQALLLAALPELPDSGSLVLVARTADQRRKLFAACLRAGAGYGFAPLTDHRAAQPWVVRFARERGHDIAPPAVVELIERSGLELGVLDGEVEKLSLHVGAGARIDVKDVRALVSSARAHQVQELTDRLARHDLPGAARLLRRLLAEGEPPIRLLAFLAANLRRALHVAELADQGLGPEQIAQRLGLPSWLVGRERGRGRAADLVKALVILRRLDLELKNSRPEAAVFDRALLEIA
jgi:DNA polymerase-3 subunit delta